jgi:uncharacterized protein (TIGR02611 family)
MKRLARELGRQTWRAGVALVGGVVVLAGVAMLVLPGPGLLAIAAGLALLALEFEAARNLRDHCVGWLQARVQRARAKASARRKRAEAD